MVGCSNSWTNQSYIIKQNIGKNFKYNVEKAFTHDKCEGMGWGIHQVFYSEYGND